MENNGFFIEADFLTAIMLMFACTLIIYAQLDSTAKNLARTQKESENALNAIFLMDTLIKNHDENFPVLGSAFYNSGLKRTEQNVIDIELLKKVPQNAFVQGLALKSIFVQYKEGVQETIFGLEGPEKTTCRGFERFVIIKNKLAEKKAKITAVVCNE